MRPAAVSRFPRRCLAGYFVQVSRRTFSLQSMSHFPARRNYHLPRRRARAVEAHLAVAGPGAASASGICPVKLDAEQSRTGVPRGGCNQTRPMVWKYEVSSRARSCGFAVMAKPVRKITQLCAKRERWCPGALFFRAGRLDDGHLLRHPGWWPFTDKFLAYRWSRKLPSAPPSVC
jgi:hypothetical protein